MPYLQFSYPPLEGGLGWVLILTYFRGNSYIESSVGKMQCAHKYNKDGHAHRFAHPTNLKFD